MWPTTHLVDYYPGAQLHYLASVDYRGLYNIWYKQHLALDLGGCLDSGLI